MHRFITSLFLLSACLISGSLRADSAIPGWLVSRVYGGVAGYSLYGIDAEQNLRPSPCDPYIVTNFDWVSLAQWKVQKPGTGGVVTVESDLPDFAWSRGTGYAHLYLYSDTTQTLLFHFSHNGIESMLWCDGKPAPLSDDPAPPEGSVSTGTTGAEKNVAGLTDQGNVFSVELGHRQKPRFGAILATPGWHHILLKLISQDHSGSAMSFVGSITDAKGAPVANLKTAVEDPEMAVSEHRAAARLSPVVTTDAPANLPYAGQPLKLMVTLQKIIIPVISKSAIPQPVLSPDLSLPPQQLGAILKVSVTDYDGHEIASFERAATFPGTLVFDMGAAPATGYYGVHLSLVSFDGKPVINYPPDGFSVIAGTAAQSRRKAAKKMAVTYYFMGGNDLHETLYFPYMLRMGIYRNIGGQNGKDLKFYKAAHDRGLAMSPDFWDHDDPAYTEAYVKETAPLVDSYKSYNEIDISPLKRKTAGYWVNREKQEYEIVKKYAPGAIVLGGSLTRVGNDPWFEECLKLGLDQYQDVWDVHAYPRDPPRLEGRIANAMNETDLGVEMAYGKLGKKNTKPFWLGETGARASHGFDARRWQAETVTKMIAWVLSRPDFQKIGFLIPWQYSRGSRGSLGDIEAGHMPAEAAYYTASALIDGFSYKALDLGQGIQAAQFGGTVLAWTPGSPKPAKVPLPGTGPWVSVDVVGRVSPVTANEDQTVSTTLTVSPVYFLSRAVYDQLTAFASEEMPAPGSSASPFRK